MVTQFSQEQTDDEDFLRRLVVLKPRWITMCGNRIYGIRCPGITGVTMMRPRPYYGKFSYLNGQNVPKWGTP